MSRVQITDHALLRYLERVEGVDIAGLRDRLADRLAEAVTLGAVAVTIDGMTYRLADTVCVTVTPRHSRRRHQNRVAREADE